jgi:Flp pilus assembly protein TadG
MKGPLQRLLGSRNGTASLEFALLGPIFVMLLFFVLGASLLLWAKGAMQMAASQTARCMAIGSSACTNPQNYATSLISAWGVAGIVPSISVSVQSGTTCNGTAGHFSTVTISSTGGVSRGFVMPLSGTVLTASACYPSGT